jgi:hypothetical protein
MTSTHIKRGKKDQPEQMKKEIFSAETDITKIKLKNFSTV